MIIVINPYYHHAIICQYTDGIQINALIKTSGLDTTIVSTTLTLLELDGAVKNIGNQTYIAI